MRKFYITLLACAVGISAWALEPEEGIYKLATPQDLVDFAALVNQGETAANAQLTADIDMSEVTDFTGIGVARDILFTGTFDGQGHKISGLNINLPEKEEVGLFHIAGGAVLKNFRLDETCTITGSKNVGLVGWCNAASGATFEKVGTAAKMVGGENTSAFIGRGWSSTAPMSFSNCWTVGEIENTSATTGNWIGWCSNWKAEFTNCWTTSTFAIAPADGNYLTRKGDNVKFNNCYTLHGSQATRMTEEDVTSGALCYMLNGDQSEITWYQTLGVDPYPVLDESHGRVYKSGKIRCDGMDTGETVYSNTDSGQEVVIPDHNFVNGVCTVCNSYDPDQIVDGVYQIGSPEQLVWFSAYVNAGHTNIKGHLTADIDMSGVENFTPIGLYHDNIEEVGSFNMQFTGTFDGGKHIIRNLTINTEDYFEAGLFSRIYQATVSDLGIENASITTNNPRGRIGAFAGLNREGTFRNCWSAGELKFYATDREQQYGGIAGNTNNTNGRFISCWSSYEGPLTTESGSFQNCSSYADDPNFLEDVKNGALCYALNGESFIDVTWYQTIWEDNYPTWDATRGIVYKKGDNYFHFIPGDETSLSQFISDMIYAETEYVEETIADKALLDEYLREVNTWESIKSYEAFCEAYKGLEGVKEAIQVSVAAYNAYVEACEYAIGYLKENDFKSDMRTFLETYLYENEEPSEDYANGTYEYIKETHLLSDDGIAAETAFLNGILQIVIATNIVPGTEITVTLPNYNFKDGLENWTVTTSNAGVSAGGKADIMNLAEGRNTEFSVSQTKQDVPNGIYLFAANGFSRAGEDASNTFYAGQIYLNGNHNFLMAPVEDIVLKDDAEDGVNCYLTGEGADAELIYGEIEGYVPASMNGCSYAFNAGRYLSQTAVEVTDGTLEIGIRNPGTGIGKDWTAFGNVHVWYLGSAEQGNERLGSVLDSYIVRAQAILDFPWSSDLDYSRFPNMPENVKTELAAVVEAAKAAESGQAKMDVINAFSSKFTEVYEARKAYVVLGAAAEGILDQATLLLEHEMIDDATYTKATEVGLDAWEVYQNGSASAEEALALAKKLNETIGKLGGVEKDENSTYRLKNAKDLQTFALFVNNGETAANAIMDADIDMSEVADFTGIGVARDILYTGTFDGQGHKISGLNINLPEKEEVGLFHIAGGAVLKNFSLDETCTITGSKNVGLVGWCNAASGATFEKVGTAAKMVGGENTSAFIGRGWSSSAPMSFTDCWTVGEIENTSGTTGNWIGWCSNWKAEFTNCWTISTFAIAPADGNYLTRKGDNVTFTNCYTLRGSQGIKMTEDDVTSGALCYNLNGDQSMITWYQTLGVDPYPVLDSSHGIVIRNADGTYANETAIDVVHSPQTQMSNGVYDLFGRRIADRIPADADLPKGIYIVGGRKVMVK